MFVVVITGNIDLANALVVVAAVNLRDNAYFQAPIAGHSEVAQCISAKCKFTGQNVAVAI